jgi:hypothetical protein
MNDKNDNDYVTMKRSEIIKTAKEIINKQIDIIEGCRKINGLWVAADLPEDDDCDFFELIDSDTDAFPKGALREMCSEEYLKDQDYKEKEYLEDCQKAIEERCQRLIEKYSRS